jgi:hypothetical protein
MHSYDGRCAQLRWSVCTVGVSTDGHGRAALAAFPAGGERRSRACIPAGRPAAREPSRDKGGRDGPVTGVRIFARRVLPARPPAPGTTEISGRQRARQRRRMAAGGLLVQFVQAHAQDGGQPGDREECGCRDPAGLQTADSVQRDIRCACPSAAERWLAVAALDLSDRSPRSSNLGEPFRVRFSALTAASIVPPQGCHRIHVLNPC